MAARIPRRFFAVSWILGCLAIALAPALAGSRSLDRSKRLVVAYKSEGPHAVQACAEQLFRGGQSIAAGSADRSDSLDRWGKRHRVSRVRAMFRRPDGTSLETQRQRLTARLMAGSQRRSRTAGSTRATRPLGALASSLANVYAVEVAPDADLAVALSELRADPHVAFAQADHAYSLDFTPNDPYLATRGSWGQDYGDLWGLERIGAPRAWQVTRGAGQIVAVVDTGLDYTHPDIAANVWLNPGEDVNGNGEIDAGDWNGVDDDGNGLIDDLRGYDFAGFGAPLVDGSVSLGDPDPFDRLGHGTHVAGTIGAVAGNGIGIAGVAPEARIMPLKGFDDEGNGTDSDLWTAVLYAIENGASVVNASWSCSPACPDNPLARKILEVADEAGVVFVTSAGNNGVDVVRNEPERTTAAITVGALSEGDGLSFFSNRGWLIDLIAPGGGRIVGGQADSERNILSLAARVLPELEDFFRVGDGYYRLQGTSMAAPHVSGAVALLRSIRPELTVAQVRRLLRISAQDLPPAGHDFLHGAGVLDLERLLAMPLPELELSFVSPSSGAMHDPLSGPLEIRVRAGGRDAEGFSLARAPGLFNQDFETLAEWTSVDAELRAIPWEVAAIEPGPQVLRLRATLRSGEVVDEFAIVGLESISPLRLSTGSFHEVRPDVSGRRVVWEALSDTVPRLGQIILGGFGWGDETVEPMAIHERDERSQIGPRIDGPRLVWREGLPGTAAESLVGCVLVGRGDVRRGDRRACWRQTIASTPQRLDPFGFARGIAMWSDPLNGRQIAGCRWPSRRSCIPEGFGNPDPARSSRLLDFDGSTLVWRSTDPTAPVGFCRVGKRGMGELTCVPAVVRSRSRLTLTDSAGLDSNRLALELFDLSGSRLAHCELDLDTGECELHFVDGVENSRTPAVSGRRIVWLESPEREDPSIAYCEVDPIDGSCVRKRLTGAPFPASDPRIDRNRIVWGDERFGPSQILGIELPGLEMVPQIHVGTGVIASIPINRVGAAAGAPWRFVVEGIQGLTPSDLDARVVDPGSSTARLTIRTRSDFAGQSGLWRVSATTPRGLETRASIEILVDEGRRYSVGHLPTRSAAE
jgi:subtilisin family serine protease